MGDSVFFHQEAQNVYHHSVMLTVVIPQLPTYIRSFRGLQNGDILVLSFLFHLLAGIHPLIYYLVSCVMICIEKVE